jgi:hypothetical protein
MQILTFRGLLLCCALAASFGLLASPSASADHILNVAVTGGTFDDGGTFSGSFVWDLTTNSITSFDITTTAGTAPDSEYPAPGFEYTSANSLLSADVLGSETAFPEFQFQTGFTHPGQFLYIATAGRFTASGGTSLAVYNTGYSFEDAALASQNDVRRSITHGTFTATPVAVPEPASFVMMGLGLTCTVAIRRQSRGASATA